MQGWRVAGAIACALLAGCGSWEGGAPAPHRPAIKMSIRAVPNADTAVDIGVDLRGRSTGGDPKVVDLEADPYPFDSFHRIATLPTTAAGKPYNTGDLPSVNTRYRFAQALGGHAVSPPITVYVHPKIRLKYETVSPTTTRVRLALTFGPDATAVRGPVYFYNRYKGEHVFRLIGKATERPTGPGRAAASVVARLDPARASTVVPCSPTTFAKGSGRPNLPVSHCGTARRVRKVRLRLP